MTFAKHEEVMYTGPVFAKVGKVHYDDPGYYTIRIHEREKSAHVNRLSKLNNNKGNNPNNKGPSSKVNNNKDNNPNNKGASSKPNKKGKLGAVQSQLNREFPKLLIRKDKNRDKPIRLLLSSLSYESLSALRLDGLTNSQERRNLGWYINTLKKARVAEERLAKMFNNAKSHNIVKSVATLPLGVLKELNVQQITTDYAHQRQLQHYIDYIDHLLSTNIFG